ncbi:MAG: ABC transporter ATP-binding protein [Oscillospiraceae bacterium]|nr:ABC transporter ATP-binding protein [Oscillospiraceae bacterium]
MADTNAIIRTEALQKVYSNGKSAVRTHALRGVDLSIPRGGFSCIVGPSGHGKSTLLQLIGGLDRPTSGNVYIDDINIATLNRNKIAEVRASKIGFVFQFFNLLPNLTALENLQTAMMLGGVKAKEQRSKAMELLELVGLSDKASFLPNQLSGGQQQRVSIARALSNDPEILLMDEPTGNLDSESEKDVLEHIFAIHKRGKTVVIVTHNDTLAARAEHLFVIKDGVLAKNP